MIEDIPEKHNPEDVLIQIAREHIRNTVMKSNEAGIEDWVNRQIIKKGTSKLKGWQKMRIRKRWTYKRWNMWMTQYNYTSEQMYHLFFVMISSAGIRGQSTNLAYNYISLQLLLNDKGCEDV